MHTLNVRQMKALAAVAPGTLALHDSSTFALTTFLLTVEDADRCGYWALSVNQDGDVIYNLNAENPQPGSTMIEHYDAIMRRQREAVLEHCEYDRFGE